jgi:hypothetical protein
MLQDSSNDIEKYTTSVIGFINKCIDNVVPTVTVRTYPNQKPWITGNIRTELKARAAAFKEWDTNLTAYKKSCYALSRTIKQEKMLVRCSRAGKLLRTTKGKPDASCPVSLPDELNASWKAALKHPQEHQLFWMTVITLSVASVSKTSKYVASCLNKCFC